MIEEKQIRLSGIIFESLVNGPGIRRVFFSQGCIHNCKGCFNPHTHNFEGGEEFKISLLVEEVKKNPMLSGVTFSGGDPFEQAESFYYLAKEIKKLELNIWCYTGYTFEYISNNMYKRKFWRELLSNVDVIIDGKFIKEEKDETLKYRGSKNQRIIDVKNSLEQGQVIELKY
ncbi:anaerobic ribonucleoside-triphosphate reductase activating protein [Hathewaya massiliensis]|uniref:anaerobic ribonucleoside-triphosphate reductase activating protein n=1 Tax=Hathewaya massiliensis TaxID=1964382 RepID=UPI0011587E87|nr:anaerobic ribonucleoside-triphosphate reductase activating protein [Hathewaya massiliensis]